MVLGVIPMVGFDVFFQIFSHLALRMCHGRIFVMSSNAWKGDPHVKGRIRQMQRATARSDDGDVPKADVIVNGKLPFVSVAV